MELLTEDDLAQLPANPEAAFVKLMALLNDRLTAAAERDEWRFRADQYVQIVLAFIDEHELPYNIDREMPTGDNGSFYDWFTTFRNNVNYMVARYMIRHRDGSGDAIAFPLNDEHRQEIHSLLNKVRKVVAVLDVSDSKRDAIYTCIAALAKEVDKARTRAESLMMLYLEATETAGEGAQKLEPLIKLLERVRAVFARAKTESETSALPSPEVADAKRITGPAVPTPKPAPPKNDLDDEIPF